MPDITYVTKSAPVVDAPWLNMVNRLVNDLPIATDAAKGPSLVSFNPDLAYKAKTVGRRLLHTVCVTDYMTQVELDDWLTGAPTLDHTAACNLATMATLPFTTNADAPKRRIELPAGNWNIAGPVYVRKGQEFTGVGAGATRILQDPSRLTSIFILGKGLIAGVETSDPGGLAPVLSNLHVHSSSATAPAVDTGGSAGWFLNELFLTNVGVGVKISGGDGVIDQCIFDQGLVGLSVGNAQNVLVSNCLFYLFNYAARIDSNTYDLQFDNCHFEYQQYTSILFNDGATNIRNVSVSDSQFLLNEQYSTFLGFVHIRTGDVEATFSHCKFRNMKGYAVTHGTGVGGDFTFFNCVFNGLKTVVAYTQGTTSGGIQTGNETMRVIGCRFLNLNVNGIELFGALASTLEVQGGSYSSLGGVFANISNTSLASKLFISGMRGDGVMALVNVQGFVAMVLKNNIDWLGATVSSGGRVGVNIPFQYANQWRVVVRANALPGGNADYRKTASFLVEKENGNSAGLRTAIAKSTLFQTPADTILPALDIQIDLGSIGGGVATAGLTTAGTLVVSVPSSWASVTFDVEPLV